jgi:hypothetical protein
VLPFAEVGLPMPFVQYTPCPICTGDERPTSGGLMPDPLSLDLLEKMHAYWRAAGPSRPRSKEAVPADVLSSALYARFRSRQGHTFGEKMLSAMRFGFGGHVEGHEPIDPAPKRPHAAVKHAAQ